VHAVPPTAAAAVVVALTVAEETLDPALAVETDVAFAVVFDVTLDPALAVEVATTATEDFADVLVVLTVVFRVEVFASATSVVRPAALDEEFEATMATLLDLFFTGQYY